MIDKSEYLILIVDDEPEVADTLSDSLSALGYSTATAYDGMGALKLYNSNKPDMIITDMDMPRISGD